MLMGESVNNANVFNELDPSNRRLGWPNLATQEHILTTSTPSQLVGSRRQFEGCKSLMQEDLKGLGKPLKLKMVVMMMLLWHSWEAVWRSRENVGYCMPWMR